MPRDNHVLRASIWISTWAGDLHYRAQRIRQSTLLRCINGTEGYQDGSIKLGGMTITDRDSQAAREISRSVGMVFQSFNLFPHA